MLGMACYEAARQAVTKEARWRLGKLYIHLHIKLVGVNGT